MSKTHWWSFFSSFSGSLVSPQASRGRDGVAGFFVFGRRQGRLGVLDDEGPSSASALSVLSRAAMGARGDGAASASMQGATRVPCAFLRCCDGRADSERGQPNDDDLEPDGAVVSQASVVGRVRAVLLLTSRFLWAR